MLCSAFSVKPLQVPSERLSIQFFAISILMPRMHFSDDGTLAGGVDSRCLWCYRYAQMDWEFPIGVGVRWISHPFCFNRRIDHRLGDQLQQRRSGS